MRYSIHVLDRTIDEVKEALIDSAASQNCTISAYEEHETDTTGKLMAVFKLSQRWLCLVTSGNKCMRAHAADLAFRTQSFVLAISVDEPDSWGFDAFNGNERIGSYYWELPTEMHSQQQSQLDQFEKNRLLELGLQGLENLDLLNKKRPDRLVSNDPRLELHYRSKVSKGKLNLPIPKLNPELPRTIHKLTGLSTAARIRKILGTPHLYAIGAATEFSRALDLANWIDDCCIDEPDKLKNAMNCFIFRMIEKE